MSSSVNKVILVGNLGRDPEVRFMNNGGKIVNLSVATSETWKDQQTGERRERTEWHRVVIFNENIANVAEQYCKKGTKVYVEGQLQTRKWQGQDGRDNYSTEIILQRFRGELRLLSAAGAESQFAPSNSEPQNAEYRTENQGSSPSSSPNWSSPTDNIANPSDDLDDEIPF